MSSESGEQTILIHILPNISKSKGNQTMIFGQLMECNMRIFFEKSFTICFGETNLFWKVKIELISRSIF